MLTVRAHSPRWLKEVWSVTDADMSMPSFKESSLSDYGYKNTPDDEL